MASNESKGEYSKNSPTTNPYSELISSIELRNQLLLNNHLKTSGDLDDTNLAELLKSIPDIEPDEHLQDIAMEARKLIANVVRNKQTSELKMDFTIDENPLDSEIDQMIENLNNKSDKIFKKFKNVQVEFNKVLNINTDIISDTSKQHFMKVRRELVEKTNAFEKDTEALRSRDTSPLGKHDHKKLYFEPVDNYVKTSDKLKQRIQNDEEIKGDGKKSSKNHEH